VSSTGNLGFVECHRLQLLGVSRVRFSGVLDSLVDEIVCSASVLQWDNATCPCRFVCWLKLL
jgi:hypothetical protein